MKKKLYLLSLVLVFSLCMGLMVSACGSASGSSSGAASEKDFKEAFLGLWKCTSFTVEGETTPEEDMKMMDSMGMSILLELKEDGTGTMYMFGEDSGAIKWEAKEENSATATIDDDSTVLYLKINEGKLLFGDDQGTEFVFEVAPEGTKISEQTSGDATEQNTGDAEGETEAGDSEAQTEGAASMSGTLVNNVELTGDPGFFDEAGELNEELNINNEGNVYLPYPGNLLQAYDEDGDMLSSIDDSAYVYVDPEVFPTTAAMEMCIEMDMGLYDSMEIPYEEAEETIGNYKVKEIKSYMSLGGARITYYVFFDKPIGGMEGMQLSVECGLGEQDANDLAQCQHQVVKDMILGAHD